MDYERKNQYSALIFWLLCTLLLISLIVAFRCMVIYTWFNYVPVVLLILCGIFVLPRRPSVCMRLRALFLASCTAMLVYCLLSFFVPRQSQQEYVSPAGKRHLVIEMRHASRPYLYLRHGIFLNK